MPEPAQPRRSPAPLLCLAGALAVGAVCRFWHLGAHSLFLDEAFTLRISALPIPQLLFAVAHFDFHPPAFYLASHYLIDRLHWDSWNYRYLTAPFGLLTILATWAIARRLSGDLAAGIGAFIVALEPGLIQWDRLFRMYSVLVALVAASWWLLLIATDDRTKKRVVAWLGYGCVVVLLPMLQYLGAVALLCQGLFALGDIRRRWPVIACGVGALGALLPWLAALRVQIPNGGYVTRAGSVMFSWWQIVPTTLAEATPIHWAVSPAFGPVLTLLAVAIILAGAWIARRTILPFWLAGAVVQIAGSLVSGKSLAIPRYLFALVPAFAIAVGVLSAASLRRKVTLVALAVPLAVLTLCGICTENILLDPYYQFSDWYAINAVVLANEHRDDAMMFDQGFPALVVAGYSAFRHHSMAAPNKPADVKAALNWLDSHRGQRIWYIENQWFYADPAKAIKRHLDGTRKVIRIWSENRASAADLVNAVLYGPARSAAFAKSPAKRR